MSAKSKCASNTIINPETGRCVKADGKIGKKIRKAYQITVVFTPMLHEYGDNDFDDKLLQSSFRKINKWKTVDIERYLKWYEYFFKQIQQEFDDLDISVHGYEIYKKKYMKLVIEGEIIKKIRINKVKKMLQNTVDKVWNMSSNSSYSASFVDGYEYRIYTLIMKALNPDVEEKYLVMYNNTTHLVGNSGAIQVI